MRNVQVDCRELTEEQIEKMCAVGLEKGYRYYVGKEYALDTSDGCFFLSFFEDKYMYTASKKSDRIVITYEKFMELFYTLENVQVDCSELTEEQIYDMCKVYKSKGNLIGGIKIFEGTKYLLSEGNICFIGSTRNKTTITYEKFMELFDEPIMFGVGNGLEKPKHYSKGIDTFARMEANCTKEECLAFVRGNLDKYTWRDKGQDLEDFEKIIAYAKWGIKLLQS